jgi:hypothetical protein
VTFVASAAWAFSFSGIYTVQSREWKPAAGFMRTYPARSG